MKYGDALPQRSVLEWLPYNLDYVEIKQFIKQHTTGQPLVDGEDVKTEFEDELFDIFMDQLGRIDLFVKSKAGEIERRLEDCQRQTGTLRRNVSPKSTNRRTKLEREIERASYEVQCLSRYVNVQRTGFHKLLKKYRKWTGSRCLPDRVSALLDQPTAFHRQDFETHILQVSELLATSRSVVCLAPDDRGDQIVQPGSAGDGECDLERRKPIPRHWRSPIDIDASLTTSSIPENGGRAVFWVHYDNLVELQVLLLKKLTLQIVSPLHSTLHSTAATPAVSRRNSTTSSVEKDDEIGIVLLDDVESFGGALSSATIDKLLKTGMRTAGQVRWCSRDSEAVIIVQSAAISNEDFPTDRLELKTKKKFVETVIDTNSEIPCLKEDSNMGKKCDIENMRAWLRQHPNVAPLVRIESKRTRFTGSKDGEVWTNLDKDIKMSKIGAKPGWMSSTDSETIEFPHAVLEVQWNGSETPALVTELVGSHMVESVPGFSLDVHAISVLYKPKRMSPPFWLPALSKDIRKTPATRPRNSRRSSSHVVLTEPSSKTSSLGTSAYLTRGSVGYSTPATSDGTMMSKKRANGTTKSHISSLNGTKYWNELDEEAQEEEPYAVLIHHRQRDGSDNESVDQTLSEFLKHKLMSIIPTRRRKSSRNHNRPHERTPLLPEAAAPNSSSSSELDIEAADSTKSDTLYSSESRYRASGLGHVGFLFVSAIGIVLTAVISFTSYYPPHIRHGHKPPSDNGHNVALDMGVFTGVVVSLVFSALGLTIFLMARERYSALHTIVVWTTFGIVCLGSGAVFAWVGDNETGN